VLFRQSNHHKLSNMKHVSCTLEMLYNTYSSMLYGIALEISPTQKEAEEILITTFQKIYKKKLTQKNYTSLCATLVKLMIQTAQEKLNPDQTKINFKLKEFEKAPVMHKLLCEQISLEQYSAENNLTRSEIATKLREEISLLRKQKTTNAFPASVLILNASF